MRLGWGRPGKMGSIVRFKQLACAVGALLLIFTSSGRAVSTPTEPTKFVQDLSDKVLAIFNDPQLSRAEKERQMYPIAVKSFDVPRTARFVLGRFWKDAPAPQRDDFTKAFEHYMVHIYAGQFDLYNDVEFQIISTRPQDTRILVRTSIIRHDGGPPVPVDWWVTKADGTYRIIDVNVEGVSQLVALREQFTAVVEQHDGSVAALTEHLREKTGQ